MKKRVQFILKKKANYSFGGPVSSGLFNSSQYVSDMLNANGVKSEVVIVSDNNGIDRQVTRFKPDIAIIEALWVVPEKFAVLHKLHPKVSWIVRIHSEMPFLAHEGVAIDWLCRYLQYPGVSIGCNSREALVQIRALVESAGFKARSVILLPNFYPPAENYRKIRPLGKSIKIGCFGAVRPLKNQLLQALAAIEFAESTKRQLSFYMNISRVEGGGEPVLKNIRSLFRHTKHELIEVKKWLNREDFLILIGDMDIAMCASLSETFCIVAADAVSEGTALVASPAVRWATPYSKADPTDLNSLVTVIQDVAGNQGVAMGNFSQLNRYSAISKKVWLSTVQDC